MRAPAPSGSMEACGGGIMGASMAIWNGDALTRLGIGLLGSACLLICSTGIVRAGAKNGAVLVAQGNAATGLPACSSCHGQNGAGDTSEDGVFPRLAGLSKTYLLKQLADFRAGRRISSIMQPIANAMSTSQAEDLADYYSKATARSDPGTFSRALITQGREIAQHGRWSVGLPPCEGCHAPGGIGVAPNFPYLADQRASYIETQLRKWRIGKRRNDPFGLMKRVTDRLRPADIAAVAAYFQSLKAPSRQGEN